MAMEAHAAAGQEIELKLALPGGDAVTWARALARVPALARHKAQRRQLHSVYFDTPAQYLRSQRAALRLRRVEAHGAGEGAGEADAVAAQRWLQALKTEDHSDSALSWRGEWESPVAGPGLDLAALRALPVWQRLDADGGVAAALQPCFVTRFERTTWTLRRRGGAIIEVALDIGQIEAGERTAPIAEVELELRAGAPADLFDLAHQIAAHVAVLPLAASKAERGFALAQGKLYAPRRAHPPDLAPGQPLPALAFAMLSEMWGQFSANLHALCHADDPELVHQARVGWRRLRSAQRLFRPALAQADPPERAQLAPLLEHLGALRDLDVAVTQVLPALRTAYLIRDAQGAAVALEPGGAPGVSAPETQRAQHWLVAEQAFAQAATQARAALRAVLQQPATGLALLGLLQWLHTLPEPAAWTLPQNAAAALKGHADALRRWLRRRVEKLYAQWQHACDRAEHSGHVADQHRARILAKRLRYNIEALRALLPPRMQRWLQEATRLQQGVGARRDFVQAALRAQNLARQGEIAAELAEFLHGVAVGCSLRLE
ncbi:CYTH and CHAD domain-containing protein [Extensimonas vulgaris]|uniref:Adenylate cyclase n=1 Tax=Extensimonas vulgaris TaxID=1031594 RepID=A0A369AHA1_9BURK|nr:CYTH and CHAD domain-containing protein [Extensimonas vulgaris]RCX08541.1 adenylate cyclase [Extensimonas vulgaris]TWI34899.1 adenylate cyclase [Extensimonas vulgaris]